MYEQLLNLDPIRINFNKAGLDLINFVLAFVMYGVALGVKIPTFKNVLTKPKSLILGLISQWILLPAATFLLVVIFNKWITPMVAMGMILVSCCPGGNISNFLTSLSGGNRELSITLTGFSTAGAIFVTPANFAMWGGFYERYVNRAAQGAVQELAIPFGEVFTTVVILLGIPLVLGILTTQYLPKISAKLQKPLQYLSVIFFVLMVVLSFSQNVDLFLKYIKFILIIVFVHNLVALGVGYGVGTLFKRDLKDRITITIETGIQNSGLGLVLLFNPKIFPPDMQIGGMLFVTAWWGIWHIISGLTVASLFRRKTKREGLKS